MPAIVSNKLRLRNVRDFVKSVDVPAYPGRLSDPNFPFPTADNRSPDTKYSNTSIYFFIGRVHSWDSIPDQKTGYSDSNPPPVPQTHSNIEYEPWRSMTSLKKIGAGDVSLMIKRHDWTTGVIYSQYDDKSESIVNQSSTSNPYYVYSDGCVFMCLDNAGGTAGSTVAPTRTAASSGSGIQFSFVTSDGYRWKMMYQIVSADVVSKFIFQNYLPIRSLSNTEVHGSAVTNWGDLQTIMKGAVPGRLETIIVEPGKQGSGYRGKSSDGSFTQSTLTNTRLTASANFPASASEYNGLMVRIANSSFSHLAEITNGPESGNLDKVTFSPAISPGIGGQTTGYSFSFGPRIGLEGDGTGASAYSDVDSQGRVTNIRIEAGGTGYSTANVTVNTTAGSGTAGVGAVARAIIPPFGGYGADPMKELGAYYAGLNVELSERGTQNTLPIGASYRQLGVIRNPTLNAGTYVANTGSEYRQMTNLILDRAPAPTWIQPANRVKGATSGAIATVVDADKDRGPGITANEVRLRVTNLTSNSTGGVFHPGETINKLLDDGSINGSLSDTLDATVLTETAELMTNSGEILYLENRSPVTRQADQSEKYKVIIEF